MRRRISEAGVFELIKRIYPDDLWTKQASDDQKDLPTWGLSIQTEVEKPDVTDNTVKEYQVLRYADKTLCSMEISEEKQDMSNHRPTPKQLESLFEFVVNLRS